MIPFEDMDERLRILGKTRSWLAEASGRSPDSIRTALAPNAPAAKRSQLLQRALSDAIEAESAGQEIAAKVPPGYSAIFQTDEMHDRADRASRMVNSPSLADFCRDAIMTRVEEIMGAEAAEQSTEFTRQRTNYRADLRVAEGTPEDLSAKRRRKK